MSLEINGSFGFRLGGFHDSTPMTSTSTFDNIKKGLGELGDAAHRWGITLTGILPFSSRGLVWNIALAPFFIPLRMVQSAGPEFCQKMRAHLDKDWNQGIQDSYIDLESTDKKELREKVLSENFRYAHYMYAGLLNSRLGDLSHLVKEDDNLLSISEGHRQPIANIREKLGEMGFKSDRSGNFYHTGTGTLFNLVYGSEENEIVICFMGLGNQYLFSKSYPELNNPWPDEKGLSLDDEKKIAAESCKAAAADWFGGIPPSARQAIEIGKMLNEATKDWGLTPVMVGHSHGGGLAQTGAVANGIKGVVFNSRPMGAGTRRYIGQSKIAENAKNITAFSGKGDWLSGNVVINRLAVIFERLTGIPVPRTVGTGYHLPNLPDEDLTGNHCYFLAAMEKLSEVSDAKN